MTTTYKITICCALGFSLLLSAQDTEKDHPLWQQTVHNYTGQLKQAMVEDSQAAQSYLINRANIALGLFAAFVSRMVPHKTTMTTVRHYIGNIIEGFVHTALGDYLNIPAITICNALFSVATIAMINSINTADKDLTMSDNSIKKLQKPSLGEKLLNTSFLFAFLMFHTALPSILYNSSLFTLEKLHTLTASPDTMQLPDTH